MVGAQGVAPTTDGTVAESTAADAQQASGYSGATVSFETRDDAIVNYAIDGETLLDSVAVESRSTTRSRLGAGASLDLSAVTRIGGSGLSLGSQTDLSASVAFDSGAEMTAHDGSQGIFVVRANDEAQVASVNLSGDASAESEGDGRVVVSQENGADGTFIVVGDGEVTVNDAGNVTARIGQDGSLVFRPYPDGRDDSDSEEERLIAQGTAAAEVTVSQAESGGEYATDVVNYGQDTTVEVSEQSASTVNMTVERSEQQGRVVIASLAEEIQSAEDVQVYVDGEAAARAESVTELESATQNGDNSRFMVSNAASAQASGEVLVGINHFSTRSVSVQDGGSSDGGSGDQSDGTTSGSGPGFGVVIALLAVLSTALLARYRD
ncbi:PGF-CTERM sorting domain-containing protein [Halorientalis sp. IM1011]|uniref:PGF-CTERM sorting domain-containing protein n=1 Tax=Halorientalis sp. IM1011 TaxID=1932360 RepID=UPI00155F8813|nr:PGF-CTERM sorting domain-containing protein [Halorientalis sp. IM1011]